MYVYIYIYIYIYTGNEPAAAADDGQAFPGLEAGKPKCSLTSRFAPTFRTKAVLTEKAVKKVQMPAQELWMAAKERRKSNFFGAAVIGVKGGAHALFSILVFADVGEAVNLGQVSRGFSEEVLYSVSLEDLWRALGARYLAAVAPAEAVAAPPFAGDPAFSVVTWACRRSFVRRLATNAAKPMVVRGFQGYTVCPFLESDTWFLERLFVSLLCVWRLFESRDV